MTILGCIIGALIDVAGATIGGIIADRIGIDRDAHRQCHGDHES